MKSRSALQFVVTIGIANFFADFTYEGARASVGPFLGSLGASAAIVGFVAGFGELMGYGLRSVSGYFADKSYRIGHLRSSVTPSICLLFQRLHLRRDGHSPRFSWCRNASGEVFANPLWKQC